MECFYHWAKKFDRFEVPISFRHKGDDNYSTWIGGILTLIIVIGALVLAIIDFIPFCQRKNYSLYYYTINLNETEEINLRNSKSSLAFGFECSNKQNAEKYIHISLDNLLELKARYIFYTNHDIIGIHSCTNFDFYNDSNILNSLPKKKISLLMCLNDLNRVIKNRYQDRHDNFAYYDIDIVAKNNVNISFIRNYLLDNDCKIELYYIDVKIEVDDYKNPIKPFLNEVFLQLDPDFHVRMNTFFMNEYFENNKDLFFPSKGSPKINNLFSRIEQYFLHRGANTGEDSFARIYVRADTRKMEIRRRYQTLLEFFADAFSFWDYLFLVCKFFLDGYDRMSLNYSIREKLFFLNIRKNFNFSKNDKKIKRLLSMTTQYPFEIAEKSVQIAQTKSEKKIINSIGEQYKKKNNKIIEEKNRSKCFDKFCLGCKKCCDYSLNKIRIFEACEKCGNNKKYKFCGNCCKCQKNKSKNAYFIEEELINDKLEVIYYLKSILLLDIFRDKINEDKKEILKFISMPIINYKYPKQEELKEEEEEEEDEEIEEEEEEGEDKEDKYYKNHEPYSDKDFSKFYKEFSVLAKGLTNQNDDKKLIKIVGKKLKDFYGIANKK